MNKTSIEEDFSAAIDTYLDGKEESHISKSSEYDGLLDIARALADKDFSVDSHKKVAFHKVIKNINECNRSDITKKPNRKKSLAIASVVVCIMGFSFSQTSLAQEFMEKIINTISLGHITVQQIEPIMESIPKEIYPVPEVLEGKIFDEAGNQIKVFSDEYDGKYYTIDGEEIATFSFSDGEIITVAEEEKMKLTIKDSKELNKYTCFRVILPSYLPDGYEFDRAEFYKNEDEVVNNTKYINLYFTNIETGKYIFMQQRFADKETGYEIATDGEVEKMKVNGVDAVISDGISIDWEANNVLYGLSGRGEITKSELIKIAESIKQ